MSKVIYLGHMSSTLMASNLLLVGLTAAFTAEQLPIEAGSKFTDSSYSLAHQDSSFSFFTSSLTNAPITDIEFAKSIAEFYTSLAEGQELLGQEFEQIWDANATNLYES